jgi:hypothetical protein
MSEWHLMPNGQMDGPIRLGMSLDEAKKALGVEYDCFRRTREAKNHVLAFDTLGVHAVIDAESRTVTGMIVFPPNSVWLAGIQLLRRQAASLRETLRGKGLTFDMDEAGLWNPTMGVCLVVVEGLIDGVQVGASG